MAPRFYLPGSSGQLMYPDGLGAVGVSLHDGASLDLGGGVRVAYPLPAAQLTAMMPSWAGDASGYAGLAQQVVSSAHASGLQAISGIASSAAGMFAAAGPHGMAIAAGIQLGTSVLNSIFASGPPPPPAPNIAGVRMERLTAEGMMADVNVAVAIGKMQSGMIQAPTETLATVMTDAWSALKHVLRYGPSTHGHRPMALFACTVAVQDAIKAIGDNSLLPAFGRLVAWGAPRLLIREALFRYAMSVVRAQADDRLMYFDAGGYYNSHPAADALKSENMPKAFQWRSYAVHAAFPMPMQTFGTGKWAYTPIPLEVVKAELDNYHAAGRAFRIEEFVSSVNKLMPAGFADAKQHSDRIYNVPLTYARAWKDLVERAGMHPDQTYMEDVSATVADMVRDLAAHAPPPSLPSLPHHAPPTRASALGPLPLLLAGGAALYLASRAAPRPNPRRRKRRRR